MMDPTGQPIRFAAGEAITADRMNRAIARGNGRLGSSSSSPSIWDNQIRIRNMTGADIPPFGVVGVGGIIDEPADDMAIFMGGPEFMGVEPTVADHENNFAICTEGILDGENGAAFVAGVATVRIEVGNDGPHTTAGVADGETGKMMGGETGATVIWHEAGPGDKLAKVRIGVAGGLVCRWVRITDATPISGFENRWTYIGVSQDIKPAGTFTDNVSSETITFYSTVESGNTGEGIEGSGDNIADFPPGVSVRPLGVGARVWVCRHTDCFGGSIWLLANTPNNAGGECDT